MRQHHRNDVELFKTGWNQALSLAEFEIQQEKESAMELIEKGGDVPFPINGDVLMGMQVAIDIIKGIVK